MKDVEKFENDRALGYDERIKFAIPTYEYIMESMPAYLAHAIKNAGKKDLLIAGSGTGNEAQSFLEQDDNWNITAIDPSPDMVGIARKKLRRFSNCKLVVGQVKGLPEAHKFDAATLSLVLHFMNDNGAKYGLLKDIALRLKKGAPLIVVDMFGTKEEIREKLGMLSTILPPIFSPMELKERSQRLLEEINYVEESRFCELLEQAGFSPPLKYHQSLMYGAWISHKL